MTTNRPYRPALAVADAVAELERCSSEQFDPNVVMALVRTVGEHPDHRPARTLLELAA
jgi:HD-GYP domain-containing protein (c-di-GMP phosphodiesterase class II)